MISVTSENRITLFSDFVKKEMELFCKKDCIENNICEIIRTSSRPKGLAKARCQPHFHQSSDHAG